MRYVFQSHVVRSAAVAAALASLSQMTWAAGFALTENSALGLGNAFAGAAAAASDASTVYWNPAGMTLLPGRQLSGSLTLIDVGFKFKDSGASTVPPLQKPGGGNGGDAGGTELVPALFLTWELMPNQVWLGLGVNGPFGLGTNWDAGWVGRFHAIESSVKAININPSIAWKINDWASVGAGFSAQYFDAKFSNAVPYSLLAAGLQIPGVPLGSEGVGTVKGDSWGWGWNVGAMFRFTPATRLGLSYRSTVQQDIEGDATFTNRPPQLGLVVPDGGAKTSVKLPDSFSVALAHDLNSRWQLLADYTWTGWSSIQDLAIYRQTGQPLSNVNLAFKDAWRFGLGANYRMSEQWTLRFGYAYDKTPVQDATRTPRLPDNTRQWTTIGASWQMNKAWALDAGFAYIWVSDSPSQLQSLTEGNLIGTYTSNSWLLGAGFRWNF